MTSFQSCWREGFSTACPSTDCLSIYILCLAEILFVWQFFFRLFADYEMDPPRLDYTQMLLYFACHPDPVEGVYRALSVATGTHIFQPVKAPTHTAEEVIMFQKWNSTWVCRGMPEDSKLLTTESLFFSSLYFPGYLTQCFTHTRLSIKPYSIGLRTNWGPTIQKKKHNAFYSKIKICSVSWGHQRLLHKGTSFSMKCWSW